MQVPMPMLYQVGLDYTDAKHNNLHRNRNAMCTVSTSTQSLTQTSVQGLNHWGSVEHVLKLT